MYKLKDEINEAASRLMFLLDYAIFPCEFSILSLNYVFLVVGVFTINSTLVVVNCLRTLVRVSRSVIFMLLHFSSHTADQR